MQGDIESVYVKTNGLRLHTVQAGPVDGPLAVLLHGYPEFWYGWRRQIPALAAAGYRVVVPDQRGYNLSDKPRRVSQYGVAYLAADVAGLITALGRDKAYLAGHDWGAAVAWETALRYPQRLEKLAILNVPHPDVMTRFILISAEQVIRSWYIFFFQLPLLPERLLARDNFALMRKALQASSRPGTFTAADLEEYTRAWAQPGALTAMLNWYRAAVRAGLRGPWDPRRVAQRRVRVPALVLWGMKDVALRSAMAWPSVDLCVDGRLVNFDQASHWVQHEEAEAVNRQLLHFFTP